MTIRSLRPPRGRPHLATPEGDRKRPSARTAALLIPAAVLGLTTVLPAQAAVAKPAAQEGRTTSVVSFQALPAGPAQLPAMSGGGTVMITTRTGSDISSKPAGNVVRPLYQMHVGPTTSCGAFSGTLQWGGNGSILVPAYISLDGRVWNNNCPGATEFVFVSYTYAGGGYDPRVGKASYSPSANVKVHWNTESELFQYGNITVDVCDNHHGWHCGKPQGPG